MSRHVAVRAKTHNQTKGYQPVFHPAMTTISPTLSDARPQQLTPHLMYSLTPRGAQTPKQPPVESRSKTQHGQVWAARRGVAHTRRHFLWRELGFAGGLALTVAVGHEGCFEG
jgi:hypothetical protein